MYETADEMSLDKEKHKRVMIYYAWPKGHSKYGYFCSTIKSARDKWLSERTLNV